MRRSRILAIPMILMWVLVAVAPPASAAAKDAAAAGDDLRRDDGWVARDASTRLEFHREVISHLGLRVEGLGGAAEPGHSAALWFQAPEPYALYFTAPGGAFKDFRGGNLRHLGGFDLLWPGGTASLRGFEVRQGPAPLTLEIVDAAGAVLLDVDHIHFEMDLLARTLVLKNMDVRLSPELARRMGEPRYAGIAIAIMAIESSIEIPAGIDFTEGDCATPNWPTDPAFDADVGLVGISSVQQVAREAGVRVAVAPSATLRNVGTADVPWYEAFDPDSPPYNNDQHPYLVWALYRVQDGYLRQLGQSSVKHAFLTINSSCPCSSGHILWAVGCEDTYGVGTNNSPTWLAPRGEVTASTGVWQKCNSHFDQDGNCARDHGGGSGHGVFDHKMVVDEPDLDSPGAEFYFEAWYVVRDDVDIFNTMGYRKVTPILVGSTWVFSLDAALVPGPVIDAWVDPASPPAGTANKRVAAGKGHLQLAVRTTDLGGGTWRYDYALMNHDFDRRVQTFRIPVAGLIGISNEQFDDLDNDPGNDWQVSVTADEIVWQTPSGDNALDWGTMFSFRFETASPPVDRTAILVPFEPGPGGEFAVGTLGPQDGPGPLIFEDDFESGDASAWD